MFDTSKTRKTLVGGLVIALLSAGFVAVPGMSTAQAQSWRTYHGYHYGGGYYGWRRPYGWGQYYGGYRHPSYYRHRYDDDDAAVAAGIIGLAAGALAGATLSQPSYSYGAPPSGYYYSPPSYGYYGSGSLSDPVGSRINNR